MANYTPIIFCLFYILGIACVTLFAPNIPDISLTVCLTLLSLIISLIVPKIWKYSPSRKVWIIAGLIAIIAGYYFQLRLPKIDENIQDKISQKSGTMVEVQGKIINEPRLNRKEKVKFILAAQQIDNQQQDNLKLYVTVPLLQGTGLYPGEKITVNGIFYQPKAPSNLGAFDFKSYLAKQGIFFGLSGREVTISPDNIEPFFSQHKLRQRIVRSQIRWLGSPFGQVLTSMVLGSRAVDLPGDIQDIFMQTGLAHALAASGFQVSLLLGVVIFFTRNLSPKFQFSIGLSILLLYLVLTGMEASVMRAVVMGIGVLFGLVTGRKVKIFSTLLLSAVILLIINPVWLIDLGFQLSFLATLGLIITATSIEEKLDWMPPTIAELIAVPLAASIWTLPLTSYVFNTIPLYSIFVNILTTPLIALISLGGMISAVMALIYPLFGSALAWLLYYPIYFLLAIVEFFANLPGSSFSLGRISFSVLLIIYLIYGLVVFNKWWQRRWFFVGLFIISMVVIPLWYHQSQLVQVTVLADGKEPIIVVQDKGKVALVGAGEADSIRYVVLPFLRQQGINHIDCGISINPQRQEFWTNLSANIPIGKMYSIFATENYSILTANQKISVGETEISLLSNPPALLKLKQLEQSWVLLVNDAKNENNKIFLPALKPEYQGQVFVGAGKILNPQWLEAVKPEIVIAATNTLDRNLEKQLEQQNIELYWTGRDGAIQWNLNKGFNTTLEEYPSAG